MLYCSARPALLWWLLGSWNGIEGGRKRGGGGGGFRKEFWGFVFFFKGKKKLIFTVLTLYSKTNKFLGSVRFFLSIIKKTK